MNLRSLDALVLSADMRPITQVPLSVWPVERAVSNVLRGRAVVIREYDVELRSAHSVMRPPSVVALCREVERPQRVPFTRMNIFLRDGFRCQYCGEKFPSSELTFDHVLPRKEGGLTSWENIASACEGCNSAKGHRLDIRPLRVPYEPSIEEIHELARLRPARLHESWLDFLYWSSPLVEGE